MTTAALLDWFRTHARRLPWRAEPRDPYHVVVSELMLQQTQVDRVAPRFEAFVARFPDLGSVAAAGEDEVVVMWSGLGYYRRARLLHRLAREVVARGGALPATSADLERLPGIGPYTAAAVASLAFGRRTPALDGNVLRVGARYLAIEDDPRGSAGRSAILAWVADLMADQPPAAVNEALMELGSTVCTPSGPACGRCPLSSGCRALASGDPAAFPPPRARRQFEDHRWAAACLVGPDGRWLLRRVDDGPILRGLWLPPFRSVGQGGDSVAVAVGESPVPPVGPAEALSAVRHGITYRRIEVVPVRVSVGTWLPAEGWRWADPHCPDMPTSSMLAKILERNRAWFGVCTA